MATTHRCIGVLAEPSMPPSLRPGPQGIALLAHPRKPRRAPFPVESVATRRDGMQIVAADIGGTHARFALAEIAEGARPALGAMRKYRTRDYAALGDAWAQFERDCGLLPRAAAIAVAAPIEGEVLTFMNSAWRIDRH